MAMRVTRRPLPSRLASTVLCACGLPVADGSHPTKEGEGGPPLAVVSHQFAEQAFAGDALGKPIKILDGLRTIIGVMPTNFSFPGKTDIWNAVRRGHGK